LPKHRKRPCQSLKRDGSICRRVDNASVGISKFRFQTIAAFGGVGFVAALNGLKDAKSTSACTGAGLTP
jgi:hypothetical protein